MIAKSSHCQLTALATAVLLSIASPSASALSLGRVMVQSALGEPLRAEVDILDINADEAASLNARVASPETFKNAGLDYNAALSSLKTSLQRRANGRSFLKLSSDHVVNEPFVDVILEASWSSGRIVRDYTLLFDPPSLRTPPVATPDKSQLPQSEPTASTTPAVPTAPKPAPAAKPVATSPGKSASQTAGETSVRVQPGQTAGRIAAAHKPASVSLDQMLVSMLRNNPNAFIGDNVNRIKAGAIVALPTPDQAQAVPADEATQIVVAQSRDFDEFRRRLASNAPQTESAPAGREASGQVQASVQDKKPAPTTPDKLTLSKGSVKGKSGEDQLANERNTQQADARAAELNRNLNELNQLAATASGAATAQPTATAAIEAASQPAPAATPAVTAPTVAVKAPAPASKPLAAEPVQEPGFIDTLLDNPMLPGGVIALLGLLAGLGYFKSRQRKQDTLLDSAFTESSLSSEAFANASGGQSIDTNDSLSTGSSMVYSPSQMESADDVDPVAEAEVYLAYGRDLQAEEILKDALRSSPTRVAIHAKLADIYAKRNDVKALESIATLAFNVTNGNGADWEHICEKGLSIDPVNALYLPGGQPGVVPAGTAGSPISVLPEADDAAQAKAAAEAVTSRPGALDELDLDLDFSLDEPSFDEKPAAAESAAAQAPASSPDELPLPTLETSPESSDPATLRGSLDFTEPQTFDPVSRLAALNDELPDEIPLPSSAPTEVLQFEPTNVLPELASEPAPQTEPAAEPALASSPDSALLPDLEFDTSSSAKLALDTTAAPIEEPPAAPPKDMLAFDLDSLSLDLAEDRTTVPADLVEPTMDPLETKLALAEEFRAIGDDDGARALIEEVLAEATGSIKAKAQQALSKL